MVNRTEKNLKKRYPDAKFVFLFYHCEKNPLLIDNFNKDIYVLSTGDLDNLDLEDEKYRHGNDWHPTEKVWQDLVPLLVEKLKTQNSKMFIKITIRILIVKKCKKVLEKQIRVVQQYKA